MPNDHPTRTLTSGLGLPSARQAADEIGGMLAGGGCNLDVPADAECDAAGIQVLVSAIATARTTGRGFRLTLHEGSPAWRVWNALGIDEMPELRVEVAPTNDTAGGAAGGAAK